MDRLVPGDVVRLAAGNMIPADLRLLEAKDFFVTQSALTGESMPVEKTPRHAFNVPAAPLRFAQRLLHGHQRAQRLRPGVDRPDRGAKPISARWPRSSPVSASDELRPRRASFTWLMIRFMIVMVSTRLPDHRPHQDTTGWKRLLFAVAVAVGLTPEMLPMIVTVYLSKGALAMSRKKVIVKRLNAIQNFGAMDILCTDKTGTLTQDQSFWSATST